MTEDEVLIDRIRPLLGGQMTAGRPDESAEIQSSTRLPLRREQACPNIIGFFYLVWGPCLG